MILPITNSVLLKKKKRCKTLYKGTNIYKSNSYFKHSLALQVVDTTQKPSETAILALKLVQISAYFKKPSFPSFPLATQYGAVKK
jgi:hypothetical protein